MPNIRFTRGGKWLHQQCKSNRHGYGGGGRLLLAILLFLGIMGIVAMAVGIMNCTLKSDTEIKPYINSISTVKWQDEGVTDLTEGKAFNIYVENTTSKNSVDFYIILSIYNSSKEVIYSEYKEAVLSQSTYKYGYYYTYYIYVGDSKITDYYSYQWSLSANKPL